MMAKFTRTQCMCFCLGIYSVVITACLGYHAFFSFKIVTVSDYHVSLNMRRLFKGDSVFQLSSPQDKKVTMKSASFKNEKVLVRKPTSKNMTEQNLYDSSIDFISVNKNQIFLYSAYYRELNPPKITIIALVDRRAVLRKQFRYMSCVYGDPGDTVGTSMPATLSIFPDHHGRKFGPAHIHCPVPKSLTLNSSASSSIIVSIVTPADKNRSKSMLHVQFPQPRQYKFLICFSPLHGNFRDDILVVENLELAQELGADHAVVYNTSIHPKVNSVLQYYVKTGFLEVKNWRNPPEPIHYKGQMGANNDCLLHNHNRTDFIVFMDFDEMIIPRVHKSWSEMMDDLLKTSSSNMVHIMRNVFVMSHDAILRMANMSKNAKLSNGMQQVSKSQTLSADGSQNNFEIGAVSFPTSIFVSGRLSNLNHEEFKFATRFHVPFLVKQNRRRDVSIYRSKTILNPRTVDYTGIHRVFSFLERQKTLIAHEKIGLVHHYRWNATGPGVKDLGMLRFAPVIVRRMKKVFKALETTS